LDGCGVTLAEVRGIKKVISGDTHIGLGMNHTQLRTSSLEYLIDPVLLPNQNQEESNFSGILVGDYCLENDFISRRRIAFPRLPDIGDVIVFPNTAGYFSHLFESPGHRGILPKEILFLENL
ncbi:MAG: hypothetical protein SGJ02_09380, partial [bacterium]|nr:hypothetical protein [bacterium]